MSDTLIYTKKKIISLSVNLKHESVKYWMTTSLYFGVENFHDSFWVFFFFFFFAAFVTRDLGFVLHEQITMLTQA